MVQLGNEPEDEPGKTLFSIQQHVSEFEELSAQVPILDDQNMEHIFYNSEDEISDQAKRHKFADAEMDEKIEVGARQYQ